jgi:selenocysteine lyase/cysteine desulfurase
VFSGHKMLGPLGVLYGKRNRQALAVLLLDMIEVVDGGSTFQPPWNPVRAGVLETGRAGSPVPRSTT